MSAQLDALAAIPADIARLEALVIGLKKENADLHVQLQERDKEVLALKSQVNSMDNYNRSWSIRIFNLPIPAADATSNLKVAQIAYRYALRPILEGAVSAGELDEVPPCQQLLERAHILPGPSGKPGSVIARFFNRDLRFLVFKHKKEHQPRDSPTPNSNKPGRYLYPIYEDMSRASFSKMRALSADDRVLSAWSSNGVISFRLANDSTNTIHKVLNVFDTVEKIIGV